MCSEAAEFGGEGARTDAHALRKWWPLRSPQLPQATREQEAPERAATGQVQSFLSGTEARRLQVETAIAWS